MMSRQTAAWLSGAQKSVREPAFDSLTRAALATGQTAQGAIFPPRPRRGPARPSKATPRAAATSERRRIRVRDRTSERSELHLHQVGIAGALDQDARCEGYCGDWGVSYPSISTSASQFTGAFNGRAMPIEERA